MKAESPPASIDLKTAAFKALLQGPAVFSQFSGRFRVSRADMEGWLEEAWGNLSLAGDLQGARPHGASGGYASPLLNEERRMLLGDKNS